MRLLGALLAALLELFVFFIVAAFMGFLVMILWNWLLVGATSIIGVGLPSITWFQGWGLSFLCSMLFKSSSSSS